MVRQGTVEGEEEVSLEVTMTDNTLLADGLATPDSSEFRCLNRFLFRFYLLFFLQ